jgi:choice-of-anchor B domain-containing protein
MHRRSPLAVAFAAAALAAELLASAPSGQAAQPNTNFIELSHRDTYAQYNDCWGYRDPNTGVEYAILGTTTGISIWNISDPFNPYETGFIKSTGSTSGWRDMDTYGDNLYSVSEGGGGLQIIDLSNPEAPDSIGKQGNFTAHTLWIDKDAGVAYCNGSGGAAAGFRAFDLATNPDTPTLITMWSSPYYHDIYVKDGKGYGCAIYNGGYFDILRLTNLPTVTVMGTATYASGFTHNAWPSDNGQYLFTTDEILGTGTVRVWDVSDTASVVPVTQFPVYANTCVHNVYIRSDTAWCSWYEEGVLAFDVTDPFSPVQIGSFDTGPDTTSPFGNYAGCWSVYPFLPSGVMVTSDIAQGMHLIAYADEIGTISGTVTDLITGDPIVNAAVRTPGFYNRTVLTNANGEYSATLPGGTLTVIATEATHSPDTSSVVILDGQTTDHDIVLTPIGTDVRPGEDAAGAASAAVRLEAPAPNPTRGGAAIAFELPRAERATLAVFDASGRRVRLLAAGALPAGRHALAWDGLDDAGRAVASGAFLLRLDVGSEHRTAKLVLAR